MALGVVAALSGCGQLFAQGQQPPTLAELNNRLDSLDAQVGELQAAVANMGTSAPAASTSASGGTNGAVQANLPVAVVEADVLNVRSEPSLSGVIVGTLLQNAEVNVLGESGNWDEISFINKKTGVHLTGWVDADYLGPMTSSNSTGSPSTPGTSSTTAAAASGTSSSSTATASGGSSSGSSSSSSSAKSSY
jgi:uncharacterized protein YgiM (DUF1202 family)